MEQQPDIAWTALKTPSSPEALSGQHDKVHHVHTRSHDHTISPRSKENKDLGTSVKADPKIVDEGDAKRDIAFWVSRGLSNEGIELNEMKLLNSLTPNYILKEYFTKVQAHLYAEPMPPRIRKNLEDLYQKVYDRPLRPDSNISMKFARAFLAQEKKGNLKFNWAGFAWKEYIRTADRAAPKSKNSPCFQPIKEEEQDDQDEEEAQDNAKVSPLNLTSNGRTSLQKTADEHLQNLRADLQTHRAQESLREFDNFVSSFLSEECLQEQAQADLTREKEQVTLSLNSAERQCDGLRHRITETEWKIGNLEALVREAVSRLDEVKSRKPIAVNDSNFLSWKAWCTELQEQCSKLGYFQMEMREQESLLSKFRSDLEAALCQQRSDTHVLDDLALREAQCMAQVSSHVDNGNTTESNKKRKVATL